MNALRIGLAIPPDPTFPCPAKIREGFAQLEGMLSILVQSMAQKLNYQLRKVLQNDRSIFQNHFLLQMKVQVIAPFSIKRRMVRWLKRFRGFVNGREIDAVSRGVKMVQNKQDGTVGTPISWSSFCATKNKHCLNQFVKLWSQPKDCPSPAICFKWMDFCGALQSFALGGFLFRCLCAIGIHVRMFIFTCQLI